MQFELSTLKNGLRVISSNRSGFETVSVGLWIKTGTAYETPEVNGISHFLEHMVFKGTQNHNALQISEEIEDVGGQTNAYTSREFTSFYAKMLKADVEVALDILAEFVTAPSFPDDEIVKEREVVVQEIKQTIDTPDDIIFDYLQEYAFPEQPIGFSILGPSELVRSFDAKTLHQYIQSNYAAENIVVCAVGNIEHQKFVEMVEKRMSDIQAKTSFVAPEQKYVGGTKIERREIEQVHAVIGFEGCEYNSENYYPSMILANILGGETSSRLFQEVREKRGLVYTIYSFANAHTASGLFGIYAGTTKEELKQMIPVVCEEIKKLMQEKATEKELQRAKTQFKAGMLMTLESSSSTSEVLARQMLLFNRIIPTAEIIENIEKVTLEDIQRVAKEIFSSNPTYCLVGDIEENYPYEEQLKTCLAK
ncbi:MAG: pitrilysin family protein [Alphaproteobacteria bacterium]|nr:pitrilysin family protein [Alphaproteobacteria bacterium]